MDARGISKETAATRAGMCPKTARRHHQAGKLPSEMKKPRTWRTWKDAFEEMWPWCREQLEVHPAGIPCREARLLWLDAFPG